MTIDHGVVISDYLVHLALLRRMLGFINFIDVIIAGFLMLFTPSPRLAVMRHNSP